MTDNQSLRAQLRSQMRQQRKDQPALFRINAADALAKHIRSLPEITSARYVAGYWATQGEIGLHGLFAPPPAFIYCLPCVEASNQLSFAPWRFGDPLVQNQYGIPEPDYAASSRLVAEAMDVVLLPLVAFDRAGGRLGMGGGYYDRSFAFRLAEGAPQKPLLVGVAYGFQEVPSLPLEAWDVPLDVIVTESEIIRCR